MSINRNRAKLKKAEDSRTYNLISSNINYPIYYDEGWNFHHSYRRGFKQPNKYLFMYEVRMYKTWKYNRKTQWK